MWPDSTVVCIATGPSLAAEDVAYVQGKARVIAVNDAHRLAPWADALYACDSKWWRWHGGVPDFQGAKYALTPGAAAFGVTVLRKTGREGLETDPTGLRTGQNSGYQAINLAVHLGAKRIVLLGYDMTRGVNGQAHFFGDHPDRTTAPFASCLRYFQTLVAPLAKHGVDVINCTRRTALTCFPVRLLEGVL